MALDSNKITKVYNAIVNKVNALIGSHDSNSSAHSTIMATKVNTSDITDNLTTNDATKVLSAKQGKVLDDKINDLIEKSDLEDINDLFTNKVMIIEFTGDTFITPNSSPFSYTGTITIYWGDGTIENYTGGQLSHTYALNKNYTIFIEGNITAINDAGGQWHNEGTFKDLNITSIVLPTSLTFIGRNAFTHCYNISEIIIPSSVTTLSSEALRWCGMSRLIIPASVTSIQSTALYNCDNLLDYQLYWTSNPIWSIYYSINTETVFTIPKGTTQLYINAGFPSERLKERNK